jgi:sterol desaturase/sphingolipid hydroxylase (fatty acid hydroxylase superfamily)
LVAHFGEIQVVLLAGMFCLLAILEDRVPLRRSGRSLRSRWLNNFGLWFLGVSIAYIVLPVYGVSLALLLQDKGWGLFNHADWPAWLEIVLAVVLLDLVLWTQHFLLHRVSWLWRLHAVHHNDHDFDIATGLRFHPLEVVYTGSCLSVGIVVLGASPLAVVLYLLRLTLVEFFTHANIGLPAGFEGRVRWLFVTPYYHRLHHSQDRSEQNSNFAAGLLSIWDRLFGTYRSQPNGGHIAMKVGLPEFDDPRFERLQWMLVQPFLRGTPVAERKPDGTTE